MRQEVEILSSDPEAGAASNSGAIGPGDDDDNDDDDNDDDSDFEEKPSASRRKRTKANNGLGKNKQPRPSKRSPDHPVREAAAPSDGALEMQQQEGGSASMSCAGGSSVCSGRVSPAGGASSTAAFSASSFDLQENTKRRNAFQAGLKAALPDDETPSVTSARESGSGGGGSSGSVGVDAKEGRAGAGGASSERSGTTSSSRGKGKGAATGRAKLTPMEQQVVDLKAKHPGVLLLVECGYRYRFFGDDALAAAKVPIITSDIRVRFVYQRQPARIHPAFEFLHA